MLVNGLYEPRQPVKACAAIIKKSPERINIDIDPKQGKILPTYAKLRHLGDVMGYTLVVCIESKESDMEKGQCFAVHDPDFKWDKLFRLVEEN